MKRFTMFYVLISFAMMMLLSCKEPNGGNENDNSDNNETIEAAFYEIQDDSKLVALDCVEDLFSSMGDSEQVATFKEFMINYINSVTEKVERELGVEEIELGLRKVSYIYNSVDVNNEPIQLSSVAFWRGYYLNDEWYDLSPDNICLMEHYTITSDNECPTQGFPMELMITGNTLTIMPDYLGYGLTRHLSHPYLNHEICAVNSVDALQSGYTLFSDLSSADMKEDWELSVLGASQGGGNALAVHKYIDTHNDFANTWNFSHSYCAVGPHNPSLTIEKYFESGKSALPVVFPMTIKSMFDSYPEILGKYTEEMMYSENYLRIKDTIDAMLESKNYSNYEIALVLLENVKVTVDENIAPDEIYLTDILSEVMLDEDSEIVKDLYRCLEKNNLTTGWTPSHPIKLFYGKGDRVVPYENSISVQEAFGSEKVTLIEADETLDHQAITVMWMLNVLLNGI